MHLAIYFIVGWDTLKLEYTRAHKLQQITCSAGQEPKKRSVVAAWTSGHCGICFLLLLGTYEGRLKR